MRDLIRLASRMDFDGRPLLADLIDVAMIRRAGPEGAINFLRQGNVPEPILSFVFDESNGFPSKIRKWLSYKLRDVMREKGIEDPSRISRQIEDMKHELLRIRDWASDMLKHPGFDISRYHSIDEATASSDQWHEEFSLHMDDGDPGLYKYPDFEAIDLENGYRMVKINPDDPASDLDDEGNLMGHCVGGDDYERKVRSRESEIWSLRDERGYPHTTIELVSKSGNSHYSIEDFLNDVDPDLDEDEAYEEAYRLYEEQNLIDRGAIKYRVEQIQGKEDKPPIDKYRPYLRSWLEMKKKSGDVEVSDEDLLSVTPSIRLIEMVDRNPSLLNDVIDHVDNGMRSQLARVMISNALRENLDPDTLSGILLIQGVQNDPQFPLLAHLIKRKVEDARPGEFGRNGFTTLMKGLSPSEGQEFLNTMMTSESPKERIFGIGEMMHRRTPDGSYFAETPEGGRVIASILKGEMDSDVISSILGFYRHNYYNEERGLPQPRIPRDVVILLPTIISRTEREIRDTPVKKEIGYHVPLAQAAALEIAVIAAPHIIPGLVSMMSGESHSGDLPNQLENVLRILRKNDPELFLQTIRAMRPEMIQNIKTLPTKTFGSPWDYHRGWMAKDIAAIESGDPLADEIPPRGNVSSIYKRIEDRWDPENAISRDDIPEEDEDVRQMMAEVTRRMLRLSSSIDLKGHHVISDMIDALMRREDIVHQEI